MSQSPVFAESLTADQLARIEAVMRDRDFSDSGFLGPHESLLERAQSDAEELRGLGITHDQIADRLEAISGRAERASWLRMRSLEHQKLWQEFIRPFHETLARATTPQEMNVIGQSWLESAHEQEVALDRVLVEGRYEVDLTHYMGWQDCPFGPDDLTGGMLSSCGHADTDVEVRRTTDGSTLFFSKLLIHLVRDHHFFEGEGLRYRLEPREAVRVLDILPGESYRASERVETVWTHHFGSVGQSDLGRDPASAVRQDTLAPGVRAFLWVDGTCSVLADEGVELGDVSFAGIPFEFTLSAGVSTWRKIDRSFVE